MQKSTRLSVELSGFAKVWKGGYFEGDPLDVLSKSTYDQVGYMSVLHATYLRCIKPYIKENTIALEIGPGRGAWTKTLLPAREIYVMDALSAAHNDFYNYISDEAKVKYLHVTDFSCVDLPDNYFDYMFSFGTFCHVSSQGIEEYARNLFKKLKPGANCFWMIGDYNKYNEVVNNYERFNIIVRLLPRRIQGKSWLGIFMTRKLFFRHSELRPRRADLDDTPSPGRWYDAGIARTCEMLISLGYEVLDTDVGTCPRDPIIHFQKPKE